MYFTHWVASCTLNFSINEFSNKVHEHVSWKKWHVSLNREGFNAALKLLQFLLIKCIDVTQWNSFVEILIILILSVIFVKHIKKHLPVGFGTTLGVKYLEWCDKPLSHRKGICVVTSLNLVAVQITCWMFSGFS